MHQLILPDSFAGGSRYTLRGDGFHHLARVLRMKEGDRLPAIDSLGGRYDAVIGAVGRDSCELILSPLSAAADLVSIHLFQCVPKGKTMDTLIRQAVEAGVRDITPVTSRYTVPVYEEKDRDAKVRRWQDVADAAVKQSAAAVRVRVHELRELASLDSMPAGDPSLVGIVLYEKKISSLTLHELLAGPISRITAVVGPEGGLSEEELDTLCKKGYNPIHLGPRILRTDSASLFAIAAVQLLTLEKESWIVRS